MIRLTKAEAQRIQAEHIEWYGRTYGLERVRALVMAADRSSLLGDGEHDIVIINRFIPRGGAIENLIPEIREREAEQQAGLRAVFARNEVGSDAASATPRSHEHDGTTALDFIAGQEESS